MLKYLARLNWESDLAFGVTPYVGPLFPSLSTRSIVHDDVFYTVQLPLTLSPFSYNAALKSLRKVLTVAGVHSPSSYGMHSPRRGGATEAFNSGCPFILVKRQGRWKSDSSPQMYIDSDLKAQALFTRFLDL